MKVRLLVFFVLVTLLLPLSVIVIFNLLGERYPVLLMPRLRHLVIIVLVFCSVISFTLHVLKSKHIRAYAFILIGVLSLLIELITSPLRGYRISFIPGGGGMPLCAVVTFILYFVFMLFVLKKYASKLQPKWILLACLIGCSLIQLPLRIISFNSSLTSLPDFLFHLSGIVMGYFFYVSNKYVKSGIVIASILCCSFLYTKGYDMYLHHITFGSISGIVRDQSEVPEFQFTDRDGNIITRNELIGKYTVLDFWNTSCGVCFREFPKFDKQYLKYRTNKNVAIYSVNVKLPRDNEGVSFETISELGYSFPTLQFGESEDAKNTFGVYVYPTVIILDKTGAIVFRGNAEKAFSFLEKVFKINDYKL